MARSYRSELPASPRSSAAMWSAALGVALVLCVAWSWLGPYGNLLFVGTVARGLIVGGVLAWVSRRAGFSQRRMAGTLAATATLLAIVGSHYTAHRTDRALRIQDAQTLQMQSTGYGSNPITLQQEYEQTVAGLSFQNYVGDHYGFTGQATDGAAALWGPWTGICLYLLEILAALYIATLYPMGQASEPICKECGRWHKERIVGVAAHGVTTAFLHQMLAGKSDKAVALLRAPDTRENLQLSLATCSMRHSDADISVLRIRERAYDRGSRKLSLREPIDLQLDAQETLQVLTQLERFS